MSNVSKSNECQSCGYETPDLVQDGFQSPEEDLWLCSLCAGSNAGMMTRNRTLFGSGDLAVAQTVCFCANVILEAIESMGGKLTEKDVTGEANK